MLLSHLGKSPRIHESAYVAPNATVCGDVTIGPGCRVLFGAQIIAEGTSITLDAECILFENAVLRSTARHALTVGRNCVVGPHAHLVGCAIEDEVFVATGASIFHAARVGKGCEVRVHAVVHVRTQLGPGDMVPIGWIAVGTPARILPPVEHERVWEVQRGLNFPLTAYGIDKDEADMIRITRTLSDALAGHADDAELPGRVSPPVRIA